MLCKSEYSLVIVFEEDDFLESLKRNLRSSKWKHRVQLTSLENYIGDQSDFEEYMKLKLNKIEKVKFKIRFEIISIPNIHYYIHDTLGQHFRNEVSMITTRLGIEVKTIDEVNLDSYMPPKIEELIESRFVICSVQHLIQVI